MTNDILVALRDNKKALAFTEFMIGGYLTPAFGAHSKSEIDLLVFSALIKAGAIDPNGPLYDLARSLNITPARARTLILNWQLRDSHFSADLTQPLRDVLQRTRFSKDGTLLTFGIESPLLKEEIIARLKAKGVFADSTFAKDIVRMPVEAFVEFLDDLLDASVKETFVARLVKDKQIQDKSFKALATSILAKLGEKVAGELGKQVAGDLVDAAKPSAERLGNFLLGLLRGKAKDAVDAIKFDT